MAPASSPREWGPIGWVDIIPPFLYDILREEVLWRGRCHQAQQEYQVMLTRFQKDMMELESVELIPEIKTATGLCHLGQLLPTKIAYDYFEECAKNTRIIGEKVRSRLSPPSQS